MRSWLAFFTDVPQPLKLFMRLYIVALIVGAVAIVGFQASWSLIPLGVTAVLFGLTLLFNVNGSADAYLRLMKTQRPGGVDYSKSFMATMSYLRIFSVGITIVGFVFVIASLTQ